jgi:hypothetical protein
MSSGGFLKVTMLNVVYSKLQYENDDITVFITVKRCRNVQAFELYQKKYSTGISNENIVEALQYI